MFLEYSRFHLNWPFKVIFFVVLFTQISHSLTYGKDKRLYEYPKWALGIGWLISCIPLILLPLMVLYNYWKFQQKGLVCVHMVNMFNQNKGNSDLEGTVPAATKMALLWEERGL